MRIYKIFIVILLFLFSLTINLKADSEKMALGLDVYNNKAACGACHILKAAASEGNIGPNLDILKPTEEQVKLIVTEGLGVMPAFGEEGILTSEGIDAVSFYVANSSGIFSSTYRDYKAFDNSASTGWWNLNPSSTYSDWFVSIDLGQSVSGIKSFQVMINQSYVGGSGNVVKVQISSTGNFSGEEITVGQYTPHLVPSTGINNAQRRFFIG